MKRTLFLLALSAIAASTAAAAVGDTYSGTNTKYAVDGLGLNSYGVGGYFSVNLVQSTRLYDSNKGAAWTTPYPNGTEGDSLMCWSHVAANAIQYWQDVYGVFYTDKPTMNATDSDTARELYNGYYSTTLGSGRDENGIMVEDKQIGNAKEINVARLYYECWSNEGGKFNDAVDWYFRQDATNGVTSSDSFHKIGGYYSNYFGNASASTPAYVSTAIGDDLNTLKLALAESLGLELQNDGNYVQVREGSIAALSLMANSGHAVNCVGFTTDSNGNLVSILVANGDDNSARLEELYLKKVGDQIRIYKNASCTNSWFNYYIREVSYINTPQILQDMLTEYRDINEAAIWNGGASEWRTQVDVVDSEIADISTGWDIYVDGSTGKDIDTEHHGYYHGYALEGRKVEFGDHADENSRKISIVGEVSASSITVSASGYSFTKGTADASIQAGADMTVRSGASLDSALKLQLDKLTLEAGSTLKALEPIVVTGDFVVSAADSATYTTRATATPEANVQSALDLREADSITMQAVVNMNGNDLYLSDGAKFYISQEDAGKSEILAFTDIGNLYLGDSMTESYILNADICYIGSETPLEYLLVYNQQLRTLSFISTIPEPTTTTLSMLALAALCSRRRRRK